jgi:hypothetical protein
MDAAAERARFRELQAGFATTYPRLAADSKAPRTVVVLPSLSLDAEVMARISGVHHYEERMLLGLNRSSQRQPALVAARRREPRPAFSTRGSCAVCC